MRPRRMPRPQRPLQNRRIRNPPVLTLSIITAIPTIIMMGVSLITLNLTQNERLRFALWCTLTTGSFQLLAVFHTLCEYLDLTSNPHLYVTRQNLSWLSKFVVDFFMGTLSMFLTAGQHAYNPDCMICWIPNLIIMFGMALRLRDHIHN